MLGDGAGEQCDVEQCRRAGGVCDAMQAGRGR